MGTADRYRSAAPREDHQAGRKTHHPSRQDPPLSEDESLENALGTIAKRLGLPSVGLASLEPFEEDERRAEEWWNAGYGDGLDYLRDDMEAGRNLRAYPQSLLPEGKSAIVVRVPYSAPLGTLRASGAGASLLPATASYAHGADYHHVLKDRLLLLADALADLVERPVLARVTVDTGPLFERALAKRAGHGFIGKNTLLIQPGAGSHFVLGVLIVDVALEPTVATPRDGCGRCTSCLDACPTKAFVAPYVLDARRCIAYHTIENPGSIPRSLRPLFGVRVFGCDECQSACPYNRSGENRDVEAEFLPRAELSNRSLADLLFLGSAGYRTLVRKSALRRVNREQLCRNAAIALANTGSSDAVAPLTRAVREHPIPLVRVHAAWGIVHLARTVGLPEAERARAVLLEEPLDAEVLDELHGPPED